MAKVVCEDCGEVIAEGVDPDDAEDIDDDHGHSDMPSMIDKRSERPETEDMDGPDGSGSGAVDGQDYDPDSDEAEAEAAADETVEESTDEQSIDDGLRQLDEFDESRDPSEWWGVSEDTDHTEVDDEFQRRARRVEEQVQKERSTLGEMLEHRDHNIEHEEEVDQKWDGTHSETIKERAEWQELRDEVADAFRSLTSRNDKVQSRKGRQVNVDAVIQRKAGDRGRDRLFYRKEQIARGDRAVGVSADFSGSMYEASVKMALAAVARACRIIGDDFTANCWMADRENRYGLLRGKANMGCVTGPDERFEWEHLNGFSTGGGTPTADGIDNMRDIMEDMTAREKVMIVVTDGRPNVKYGGGEWGVSITGNETDDAAHVVREARNDGFKVIGLGVGDIDEETLGRIFGPDGYVTADMDNLAQRLVDVYRRQIDV